MTSEVIEVNKQEPDIEYPYLAVSENGDIVLFIDYRIGTVVGHTPKCNQAYSLGHHSEYWTDVEDFWTPLPKGTQIKLTQ